MGERHGEELDDVMLAGLRGAVERVDPVPASVREAAIGAFSWRTVDAELAELAYDSVLEDSMLLGIRGDSGPRLVTFTGGGLTIEVEVSGQGRHRRLVGQLVPPAERAVEVHHAGAIASTRADELGRFMVEEVHAGPVRISCEEQPPGRRVDTDWITL